MENTILHAVPKDRRCHAKKIQSLSKVFVSDRLAVLRKYRRGMRRCLLHCYRQSWCKHVSSDYNHHSHGELNSASLRLYLHKHPPLARTCIIGWWGCTSGIEHSVASQNSFKTKAFTEFLQGTEYLLNHATQLTLLSRARPAALSMLDSLIRPLIARGARRCLAFVGAVVRVDVNRIKYSLRNWIKSICSNECNIHAPLLRCACSCPPRPRKEV